MVCCEMLIILLVCCVIFVFDTGHRRRRCRHPDQCHLARGLHRSPACIGRSCSMPSGAWIGTPGTESATRQGSGPRRIRSLQECKLPAPEVPNSTPLCNQSDRVNRQEGHCILGLLGCKMSWRHWAGMFLGYRQFLRWTHAQARRLRERGCLWNSHHLVALLSLAPSTLAKHRPE